MAEVITNDNSLSLSKPEFSDPLSLFQQKKGLKMRKMKFGSNFFLKIIGTDHLISKKNGRRK
jgi:hypothetical protein